jgi:hypothetical protein
MTLLESKAPRTTRRFVRAGVLPKILCRVPCAEHLVDIYVSVMRGSGYLSRDVFLVDKEGKFLIDYPYSECY